MTASSIESVAVVVCTRNRCESLRQTLESLVRCVIPPTATRGVWVVDNASTDGTPGVVEEFRERLDARYVLEEKLGLSNARNRAVEETRGCDLVLFTDDDVRADEHWIAAYLEAAVAHPDASFFGGRVKPMFPSGRPRWLRDDRMDLLDGLFVSYDPGGATRELTPSDILPVGASMGLRAECFARGERFRTDLGLRGDDLGRGEDTEFLARLRGRGMTGVYVADALSHHEVAPGRLTWSYAFRYGMACDGGRGSRVAATGYAIRGLRQWAVGRGDRARQCAIRAGMEIRAMKEK